MKRINKIRDKICAVDNGIHAVINGTQKKRNKRETKKLLYDEQIVNEHLELWHQIDPEKAKSFIEPICNELSAGT